jgi:hypothetical protein
MRTGYSYFVGKHEGKRLFGMPRGRWENMKMGLNEYWMNV